MEKHRDVIILILGVLILINIASTCSVSSKLKSMNKIVKQLDTAIVVLEKRPVSLTDQQIRDAVRDECMETMYKYLIYETDLDQNKTSLSQIRSDVDQIKSSK